MENKIELIKSLNVNNYIDFHSKIYEDIPNDLLEAESRATDEIYKEYERYKDNLLNGTKKRNPKRRHQLTIEQSQALEEYRDLQKWVELMKKTGNPIIDFGEFLTLKTIVSNYVLELDPISKAIEKQIVDRDIFLSKKFNEYIALIDDDLLELTVNQEYVPKTRLLDAGSTFCNVKVCQWISSMLAGDGKEGKIKDKPIDSGSKIEWKSSNKALYFIFNELRANGFIEQYSNMELAKVLKNTISGLDKASIKTIAEQFSSPQAPKKGRVESKTNIIITKALKFKNQTNSSENYPIKDTNSSNK